jgi:hypothetical protein
MLPVGACRRARHLSGDRVEQEQRKPSLLANAGFAVLLIAIVVVALYGLSHASLRTINPAQQAPKRHFAATCATCHPVSASAKLVRP